MAVEAEEDNDFGGDTEDALYGHPDNLQVCALSCGERRSCVSDSSLMFFFLLSVCYMLHPLHAYYRKPNTEVSTL